MGNHTMSHGRLPNHRAGRGTRKTECGGRMAAVIAAVVDTVAEASRCSSMVVEGSSTPTGPRSSSPEWSGRCEGQKAANTLKLLG